MAQERLALAPTRNGWYRAAVGLYEQGRRYAILRLLARWLLRITLLALFVLVWQLLVDGGTINDAILPRPFDVIAQMEELIFPFPSSFFWDHWSATVTNTLAGFGIGAAIGLTLATLIVLYPRSKPFISDSAVSFEAIPKVTIIPVLFAWFGFGGTSMIVLAIMITFFPVFLTGLAGMTNVPAEDLRLLASLRANRYQTLYLLRLPHSLPNVFGGLKIGVANAMIGAILAEFLFGNRGLGFLVVLYDAQLRLEREFAAMFLVALTFVLLFAVLELAQRRIAFWSKTADEIIAERA